MPRAIKFSEHISGDKRVITVEEFKKWLKTFDKDRDGRLSRGDIADALRSRGVWFPGLKSYVAMGMADIDGNGFIEDFEMDFLLGFAEKYMGFKFYSS